MDRTQFIELQNRFKPELNSNRYQTIQLSANHSNFNTLSHIVSSKKKIQKKTVQYFTELQIVLSLHHATLSPSLSSLQIESTQGLRRVVVHRVWKKPLLTVEIHRKRRVCGHSPSRPYSKLCFLHRRTHDELDATAEALESWT